MAHRHLNIAFCDMGMNSKTARKRTSILSCVIPTLAQGIMD